VGAERYEAGRLAEPRSAHSGFGLHLLDDGFQHRQLHRDVDILLLSSEDLGDHLLPAGNLRETLHGAKRADVIAIPENQPEVAEWLKSTGWKGTVWSVRRRMEVPQIDGPVVAFCGIARAEQFFDGIKRAGLSLAARFAFADHHPYTTADFEKVGSAAQKAGAAAVLTTEKDLVRIGAMAASFPASIPLRAVQLRIEIENEAAAIDWLIHILKDPA
jgi:tetraacyldisaccharide 4'-kinase